MNTATAPTASGDSRLDPPGEALASATCQRTRPAVVTSVAYVLAEQHEGPGGPCPLLQPDSPATAKALARTAEQARRTGITHIGRTPPAAGRAQLVTEQSHRLLAARPPVLPPVKCLPDNPVRACLRSQAAVEQDMHPASHAHHQAMHRTPGLSTQNNRSRTPPSSPVEGISGRRA